MTTTTHELDLVSRGYAAPGDLVQQRRTGQIFKVTRVMKVNYAIVDEDGKAWKIKFAGVTAAPEGVVWSGPDRAERDVQRDQRRAAAAERAEEFSVGDVVEMVKDKDKRRFPGTYLITKRTAPTRFKLVGVGTGVELTSPASLIKKA